MTPCVFCELIAGRLGKGLVEETELTLTIVNIRQFEVGRCSSSAQACSDRPDLTNEESCAVMDAVRRVSAALVKVYSPDGITLYNNNGVASLQKFRTSTCTSCRAARTALGGAGPPHIAPLERRSQDILDRFWLTSSANMKSLTR